MRYVIRNCSTPTDHALHVSDPRPSMHQCVDGLERFVCPGGRLGDRRIRECDDIAALVAEVLASQTAPEPELDDDEPDWEAIVEARNEARAEYELERAEARYERFIYGD